RQTISDDCRNLILVQGSGRSKGSPDVRSCKPSHRNSSVSREDANRPHESSGSDGASCLSAHVLNYDRIWHVPVDKRCHRAHRLPGLPLHAPINQSFDAFQDSKPKTAPCGVDGQQANIWIDRFHTVYGGTLSRRDLTCSRIMSLCCVRRRLSFSDLRIASA